MKSKSRFKKQNSDPDLDWLHEDVSPARKDYSYKERIQPERSLRESVSYILRSILAIFICLVIPVFWYVNRQLSAFADRTAEMGSGLFENPTQNNVSPPVVPSVPGIGEAETFEAGSPGLTDYIGAFKESAYADKFSLPEISAFYHSDLTIEYLNELNDSGYLEELTFPAVITFFETGVAIDYLDQMKEGGYLDRFSYPEIAGFYDSGIPVDFLNELREKNLLKDLSFVDVLVMFESQ